AQVPGQLHRARRLCVDGGRRGHREHANRFPQRARSVRGGGNGRTRGDSDRLRQQDERDPDPRLLVEICQVDGTGAYGSRAMTQYRERVEDLLADYAWRLDNDKLEAWTELFTEDARYEILPRDNVDRGYPLALMCCRNQAMLRDRIL